MIDFAKLTAPIAPDRVSWRVGSTTGDKTKGMALAYIDARDVMQRLDEVCGPAGWQCRYSHANGKTVCDIGIKCDAEWVWKADGAGDSDVEKEKGALSDAFKRAAVRWGIGRYLYDLDSPWVRLKAVGKSYAIDDGEYARLRSLLGGKKAPAPVSAPPAPEKPKGKLTFHEPQGEFSAETATQWLDLYENAARHFGFAPIYELNRDLLVKIQAQAARNNHSDLVERIKRIFDATQKDEAA